MRERFTPENVNSSNIDEICSHIKPLDEGNDSVVFRMGDYVAKRYWMLSTVRLQLYVLLTNGPAQEFARIFPKFRTKNHGELSLQVEPILKVFQGEKSKLAYSMSRYADGVRPTDDKDELLSEYLYKYSLGLEQVTGFQGVYVLASNTKLLNGVCNITDLCGSVARLNPR